MEKSGRRQDAAELGGEFPVQDCASGEGGLIQVTLTPPAPLFRLYRNYLGDWTTSSKNGDVENRCISFTFMPLYKYFYYLRKYISLKLVY